MKTKINVAVTGVGGGVGQSIIKSLYDTDYEVVGLDGEKLGTGIFAVKSGYQIPYAKSPDFIDKLLEICKKESCKLLFPGLDAELMPLSNNRERFKEIGTTVVVSSQDVIEISDNKLETYQKLTPHGISVPVTMDLEDFLQDHKSIDYPVIFKQKVGGARSKNVFLIRSAAEMESFLKRKDVVYSDFIAQQYIDGDEYTCGSINFDGECKGVIVMKRTLRDGDTYKCFSVKDETIEKEVRKVMGVIKPFGACNVQLRLKDGIPYIFEINARCSGTTAARTLSGFNEPRMIADYLLFGKTPEYEIKEISVLRYWKELVVENERVADFNERKHLISPSFTKL